MKSDVGPVLSDILKNSQQIVELWLRQQMAASSRRADLISEADLRRESTEFLKAFRQGVESGELENVDGPTWAGAREILTETSRSRARQGFTPSETATFVFSL